MPITLHLPSPDRTLQRYTMRQSQAFDLPSGKPRSRIFFSAAHVVADPLADTTPAGPVAVDWDCLLYTSL